MIKWNDDLIKEMILKCKDGLGLNRMPTAREINSFYGNNALHNKICKTKKYSGWAEYLGLTQTKCETRTGQKYEQIAINILNDKGYTTKRMGHKSHFDILVNDITKLDIKSGKRWYGKDKIYNTIFQANSFGINKKYATCDIYMMFVLDDEENIEKIYIIPSFKVRCTTMTIGKNSHYDKWVDRYDILDEYIKFYKGIDQMECAIKLGGINATKPML